MWCPMCVVCTDMCVGAHANVFTWRPEVNVRCLSSVTFHTQFFETGFPRESEIHLFDEIGRH